MHTEMATGNFDGKPFRMIMDIGNRGMRLEYENRHIDIDTQDLARAMLSKISELNKNGVKHVSSRKKKEKA
jgi:hypothetical protein